MAGEGSVNSLPNRFTPSANSNLSMLTGSKLEHVVNIETTSGLDACVTLYNLFAPFVSNLIDNLMIE